MSDGNSSADHLLRRVIRDAVTPVLKSGGFRKSGRSFHRRHGQTVQVIGVQVSHGSDAYTKRFYINVGIAFDAICELMSLPILEQPQEWECDARGTRDRLENLLAEAPSEWTVRAEEDITETICQLQTAITRLLAELDRITDPASYRAHRWFERFRPKQENAQILYLTGDLVGAWQEVQRLAQFFADRQNANRPEWLLQYLGLPQQDFSPHLPNLEKS